MNSAAKYFEKNGYVVFKNALTLEQCNLYVRHMFNLYEQGKLAKDDQCPLSDSLNARDSLFDDLLQKLTKSISDNIGRKLIPTYAYARIYRPGEILERHKDRSACEISVTLTLGYDANKVWPIFFDEEKQIAVDIEIGELAIYKGCEILHWRPSFNGNWHVQVFLHYVDANGPYRHHGRSTYEIQKDKSTSKNESKAILKDFNPKNLKMKRVKRSKSQNLDTQKRV